MFENFIKDLTKNLASIKELQENEFEVIVSSDKIDRAGESINQDWIDLKEYMQNPVVLINHDYRVESIVGKSTKVWKDWNKTYARWVFSQTNPKAKLVQDLYLEWMLKAVSIWFIPYERKNWDTIVKSSMLEFSFVAVPCNPEALDSAGKELIKKWIEEGLLKEVEKEVEEVSLKDIMNEVQKISKALADDKAEKEVLQNELKTLKEEKEVLVEEIKQIRSKKSEMQDLDKLIWEQLKNFKFEIK